MPNIKYYITKNGSKFIHCERRGIWLSSAGLFVIPFVKFFDGDRELPFDDLVEKLNTQVINKIYKAIYWK